MNDTAVSFSFSTWRKIAMATWRPRKDPMIWATADIEATALLRYIENVSAATGCHLTPAHLVGRAAAKVFQALPGLNGRVAFGSFLPSPTIDCFFVVSLRTDPVAGAKARKTDLSGVVVRQVDKKAALDDRQRAGRPCRSDPPRRRSTVQASHVHGKPGLPPILLRPVMDGLGFMDPTGKFRGANFTCGEQATTVIPCGGEHV